MTSKGEHTVLEPKTAEEYRQTADAHTQTLKDFWKRFLVSGLFVIAAVIIIFACLAWFVSNNRVSAETASLSAKAARFTLVAEGEGDQETHVGYYERTPEEKAKLGNLDISDSMTVTVASNLNNEGAGSLHPGARGAISFSVVPLTTSLGKVEVDLSRVLQTKDVTGDGSQLTSLFENHLLLFRNCDNGFYSNRITDGKIEIEKSQFCKDESTDTTEPVKVDLYWVWPEHLQNYVLVDDALYYNNLFASTKDGGYSDDYTLLQSFINQNKSTFYYGESTPSSSNNQGVAAASAPNLSPSMSAADIETCAELYNNADEYIGSHVTYLQLKITAREV